MRARWSAPLAVAMVALAPVPAAAAPDPLGALKQSCKRERSNDPAPARQVDYRICAAKLPSFDGTSLDVTLTLPAHATSRRLPLIVFVHGFLNSKREYLSQTRIGTGPDRGNERYKTIHWNNVWFASRGYAVLNYSARGNGNSGGRMGLADRHIEIRDTHYLTGLLADDVASAAPLVRIDPRRVAAIGGSYGGGQVWLLLTTRENDRLQYGSWRSPGGRLVRLAAVVPGFTWTDVAYTLAPNGRQRSSGVVDPASADNPLGVVKATIVSGLLATSFNKLSPEVYAWTARFLAGEPYDLPGDSIVAAAKRGLLDDRSAYFQDGYFAALRAGRQRRVPVLAAQGWTDPIFPAIEAVRMYNRLRATSPGYPIELYLGDFEHMTALAKPADFDYWHALGNRMLDHYLRGRAGRPRYDVRSAITNCNPSAFGPVVRAASFAGLEGHHIGIALGGLRTIVSPLVDPRGLTSDSAVLERVRGRGCITTKLPPTPGVATYTARIARPFTLIGMPRVQLRYQTLAPDIQLNGRLWDVAPDGTQTLVTRGAYRAVRPDPAGATADYELFGNAWRFAAGHQLMLEIVTDDATYLRPDNFPAVATISDARLVLPVR